MYSQQQGIPPALFHRSTQGVAGEVAELLRHSDIRITMRYAHLAPEQVPAAVERLEPLTSYSGHTE